MLLSSAVVFWRGLQIWHSAVCLNSITALSPVTLISRLCFVVALDTFSCPEARFSKMYDAFKKVDSYLKRKPKIHDPRPDNFVFRLHYQYTFTVLALSVILVTSYGYIDSAGQGILRFENTY